MGRVVALALLCLGLPSAAAVQDQAVLRIRVVLSVDGQTPTPIRRHLLLVSDNPASAPPRRVFTAQDGTVDVRLVAGSYTVESDRPVTLAGRAYQWTSTVQVVAGKDTVLELTAANADASPVTASEAATSALTEDPTSLAARWQSSVVGIWSPTAHASGVVVDAAGLIVTNQQTIGAATNVEVQFSPSLKVAGHVVVTDPERDVAVVRIDPGTAATVPVVPLGCGEAVAAPATGDEIVAIEAPLGQAKGTISGTVLRVASRVIESDLLPGVGGSGGPVFSTRGVLLGITSEGDERMRQNDADTRIIHASEICALVERARKQIAGVLAPEATALPVEPARPYPTDTLEDAASLLTRHPPLLATSAGFEIAFLTPKHVWAGQQQRVAASGRTMRAGPAWLAARAATEFANWSDYVADVPPVVFIRVTPKMVESVWMKIARGAAYTQGVALPKIARPSSGFSHLRAFCGDTAVMPIHPFVLEIEVSDAETMAEGLYAFASDALAPACGTVRLELYSQKNPAKADTLAVDAQMLQRIQADFAAARAPR